MEFLDKYAENDGITKKLQCCTAVYMGASPGWIIKTWNFLTWPCHCPLGTLLMLTVVFVTSQC